MSLNIKSLVDRDLKNSPLLSNVRKITTRDCPLLISLLNDYNDLDKNSPSYQKAACSVIAAILLQERVYFCLSRRTLSDLMLNDTNYPENITRGFKANHYKLIFAKLINVFKIFELVQSGDRKNRASSIYKVSHPEILTYLQNKVDHNEQLNQCLSFTDRKKVKK